MAKDLSVKLVINGEDRSAAALSKTRAGLNSISQGLDEMRDRLNKVLLVNIGSLISRQVGEIVKTADAYKTLEARLKLVSDNTREYNIAQAETFAIANRTRQSLESTATLYGKVETVIKQLGGTQKDALKTTETLGQAIALTSQGAATDSAAILQFSQALASGVLRGDEFNSVMENSPGLAQALADGLDVPITKLRGMAEAGELTADKLVNALGKSAPKVAEQFAQLPVTVGGALTVLSNKFTKFIGEGDKATGATAALAKSITTLGNNLDKVVDIGVLAAEIYGVKLVAGLGKSLQATLQSVKATQEKVIADRAAQQSAIQLMQTDLQMIGIKTKTQKLLIEEARLQVTLANTEKQRAQALRVLQTEEKKLQVLQEQGITKQRALSGVLNTTAGALSKTEKAFNAANTAMSAFVAFEIGQTVGEWLRQFELARTAGSYLAETFTLIGTGIQGMFDGLSISERFNQIKQIHADFAAIRAADTNEAVAQAAQTGQAEATKTAAIEQAAIQQTASFAKVKEATTQLTAQIDADAKAQTASIQTALADKLAAIDASNASDIQKGTQRLEAKNLAAQQELQLVTQTATAKIALIDQEYAKELQASQANKERTQQLETEKRQAKLGVYTGLAEYYQGEVNRLQGVYSNEYQLAAQAKQNLQTLEQNHRQALTDIDRLGLDEKKKIESEKSEFEDNLRKVAAEKKKGDQADQAKINELLDRNRQLHQDITSAAVTQAQTESNKDTARYEAKDRLNKLYAFEKTALQDNIKAHEDNAAAAAKSLEGTKEKLDSLNGVITSITDQLKNDLLVKIGIDGNSVTEAQSIINDLIKPAVKTITVRTVKEGDPGAFTTPQGGAEHAVTGTVGEGFATGGFIPGYGGGDQVPALLERGEFVIPKEKVKQHGLGLMEFLRTGKAAKFAAGGLVGLNISDELAKIKKQRDEAMIRQLLGNVLYAGSTGIGGYDRNVAGATIGKAIDKLNYAGDNSAFRKQVSDIIDNMVVAAPEPYQNQQYNDQRNQRKNKQFDTAKILTDNLLSGGNSGSGLQIPQPNLSPITGTGGVTAPRVVTVTEIKFTGKDGSSVTGQFSGADDHNKLLKILRDSGGVTI
jgi:tape measure domain-containing protein